MWRGLFKQLIREAKSSWKKTVILGLLLLVGLCFWLPPLLKSVAGGSSSSSKPATPPSNSEKNPVEAVATFSTPNNWKKPASTTLDWRHADELLQTDPLVRSVEVAAIQSDPFQVDHDQFPPPILFEEEPKEDEDAKQARLSQAQVLQGLVLKSTIVGVRRRAAFINNRLYFEGKEVAFNGESYLLAAVYPKRVILKTKSEQFELTIKRQATKDTPPKSPGRNRSSGPVPQ